MLAYLKNRRGFTLIELMMVIAVIGILAAVLIPKIGTTKTTAKLAGVESNSRQVVAQVNGLVERYKGDGTNFEGALVSALNADGSEPNYADPGDINNPFDSTLFGAVAVDSSLDETTVVEADITNAVFVDDTASASAPGTNELFKGMIYVTVATDTQNINGTDYTNITSVTVTPYDENGAPMDTLETLINLEG